MKAWGARGQLEVDVLRTFNDTTGICPVGSLVRLQSEPLTRDAGMRQGIAATRR